MSTNFLLLVHFTCVLSFPWSYSKFKGYGNGLSLCGMSQIISSNTFEKRIQYSLDYVERRIKDEMVPANPARLSQIHVDLLISLVMASSLPSNHADARSTTDIHICLDILHWMKELPKKFSGERNEYLIRLLNTFMNAESVDELTAELIKFEQDSLGASEYVKNLTSQVEKIISGYFLVLISYISTKYYGQY